MPPEMSPLVHLIWSPFIVFMIGLAYARFRTGGHRS